MPRGCFAQCEAHYKSPFIIYYVMLSSADYFQQKVLRSFVDGLKKVKILSKITWKMTLIFVIFNNILAL